MKPVNIPETKYHIVGGDDNLLVLRDTYDADQLWLPFIGILVFSSIEKETPKPYSRHNFKTTSYVSKKMDLFDFGSEQRVLPFKEGKQLTNRMIKIMTSHGFPRWDRTPDGEVIQVTIDTNETRKEIVEWCSDNLKHHFHLKTSYSTVVFTLACELDAVMVKMRFG